MTPSDRHKLPDRIWNNPSGRLWLYRYRTPDDADDLAGVIERAVAVVTERGPER